MCDSSGKKELTFTALVLGVILAVVFGAANAYLGLRVGLTVSASVPAAVISMGVLRFVLRRDSILENNMVQTIGSAGESLAAGAIFTLPARYLWAEERPAEFAIPEILSITLIALAVLALLRVPVMPVAIGMYLPVGLSVTMFAGGLVRWGMSRMRGEGAAKVEETGTLFSAGLVAGEGLCGIILAILALI